MFKFNNKSTQSRLDYSHKISKTSAFTIVELLVVIVVIGILAAITIVSYTGIANRAVTATLQSDLNNASTQLKLYQVEYGLFPTTLDVNNCPSAPTPDTRYCIKLSPNDTYTDYIADNSASPQTFRLVARNSNGSSYYITDSASPVAGTGFAATGGTVADVSGYRVHTFTSSGTLAVSSGGTVQVLVVAGGGSGGNSSTTNANGGGGGGGVIYNSSFAVTAGSYTVTVGAGGVAVANATCARGNNGQNSVFGSLIAIGGGGGGSTCGFNANGGGSGGGAAFSGYTAGVSTQSGGFGNAGGSTAVGYTGGGGGGAGGAGVAGAASTPGGNGGSGYSSAISGTTKYYAGGGGGGANSSERAGDGFDGGGRGSGTTSYYGYTTYTNEVNAITRGSGIPTAIANTGGGGGGGSYWAVNGGWGSGSGAGGSGIVIVRYTYP